MSCITYNPHILMTCDIYFSRADDVSVCLALLILQGSFFFLSVEGLGNIAWQGLTLVVPFSLYQWCNDQIWIISCSKKISEIILTTQLNMALHFQHSVKSVLEVIQMESLIGNILLLSLHHGQDLEYYIMKLLYL